MLILTTRPWRHDGALDERIAYRLESLQASGWMVRTAHPRNFALWRQGRVQKESRLPVLVLPDATFRFTTDERNLLALWEMLKAVCRAEGRPIPHDEATQAALQRQAGRLLFRKRQEETWRGERLLDQIERKIARSLSRI